MNRLATTATTALLVAAAVILAAGCGGGSSGSSSTRGSTSNYALAGQSLGRSTDWATFGGNYGQTRNVTAAQISANNLGRPRTSRERQPAKGLRRLLRVRHMPAHMASPDDLITCSLCLHVLRGSQWIAAEQVIRQIRSYELAAPPQLRSGVCDSCAEEIFSRRAQVAEPVAA